jgi:four helix bundle protein
MRNMENMEAKRFQTFEDLECYKLSREFRKSMYAVTRRLPDFEKFELASQIRRASVSLTNNISEGHGRFHFLDQIKFMLQARGSLQELIDDVNVCEDEQYLVAEEISRLKAQGWEVLKLLNGYLRWLRDKKVGQNMELREFPVLTMGTGMILWKSGSNLSLCNPCNR